MSIDDTFTSSSLAPYLANPSLANANPTPPNPAPVPAPAPLVLAPAPPPNLVSPAPSSQESDRAATFKQVFNPGESGMALRQAKRYNMAKSKKTKKLQGLRSYGPGEALDPPLAVPVETLVGAVPIQPGPANIAPADPPLAVPVETLVGAVPIQPGPANIAPACLNPPNDGSFSNRGSSEPMSAFIRSMAAEAEAMEKELVEMEEHDQKSMSSISTTDMYDD
jgi:hypothetical protein